MRRFVLSVLTWAVVLAVPVVLLLTVARVLVSDWYPRFEYARPGFPQDTYGWTQDQRLELALVAMDYLNRPEPADQAISLLAQQQKPGTREPLYTSYEIQHMLDVKRFTDTIWRAWLVALAALVAALAALVSRRETRSAGWFALRAGGVLTVASLIILGFFVLVSWRTFFVGFHEIFFSPGTWTFDWSDSLIRLFPDRFWFDGGVFLTSTTLLAGLVVAAGGHVLWRRTTKA